MLFLEDLAKHIRLNESAKKYLNELPNKIELTPSQNILKFNYCFNTNLKFDGSIVKPSYLLQKAENFDDLKKELTFEANEESSGRNNMNLIKFNLSDSDSGSPKKVSLLQTFTFHESDEHGDGKINEVKSIIEEEHEEMNESRLLTGENNRSNSPIKKVNLLNCSHSSPSLLSNNRGNVFNLRSICGKSKQSTEQKEPSLFKAKRCSSNSEESCKMTPCLQQSESSEGKHKDFVPMSPDKNMRRRRAERQNEGVPMSPDKNMKRKRALRAQEIANNPRMLISHEKSSKVESSIDSSNSGSGCLKMNMCFNRDTESEYDPNDSYHKPEIAYEYSPFESIYKLDPQKGSMKMYIEEEIMKFDRSYNIKQQKMVGSQCKSPVFDGIFESIKEWAQQAKMESEIPIMALVYVERLMKKTGILINENNWSRIVLTTLCVASKIWDDDSLENEHFAKVFPEVSLKEISVLEKTFLNLIEYEVMITSKQFTKYSFILSTFCNGLIPAIDTPVKQRSIRKLQFESERVQNKYRGRFKVEN